MIPRVSVIVTVRDAADRLPRCLDSLLSQTLGSLEIIAVNDGSTDGSLEILRCYARRDCRVTVVNRRREGIAAARNAGLQMAWGEYIGFADACGMAEPAMYACMLESAQQTGAGLVMCNCVQEYSAGLRIPQRMQVDYDAVYDAQRFGSETAALYYGPDIVQLAAQTQHQFDMDAYGNVFKCLYKAAVIKQHSLLFADDRELYDIDALFNLSFAAHCNRFAFVDSCCCHCRAGGRHPSGRACREEMQKQQNSYERLQRRIADDGLDESYLARLNRRICLQTAGLCLHFSQAGDMGFFKKISALRLICGQKTIRQAFKRLETGVLPRTRLKPVLLLLRRRFALPSLLLLKLYDLLFDLRCGL